jgi:molybdopterin converting factor small subunit
VVKYYTLNPSDVDFDPSREKEHKVTIKVSIHKTHRQFTEGKEVVETRGSTIGECLRHVIQLYPGMKDVLFDKKGGLSRLLEIYLNHQSAYPDELKKPVKDGDVIHLVYMLAGG